MSLWVSMLCSMCGVCCGVHRDAASSDDAVC
jgi:hypothetical protein